MFNSLKFKVILFGFIFTFFSSFGQSYFLGLFNSSIRDALSITHGQFGSIYASATLCSSLLLIWVGKKIDDVNIFKFALFVIILLSFACFFFSKVSSVFLLFIEKLGPEPSILDPDPSQSLNLVKLCRFPQTRASGVA